MLGGSGERWLAGLDELVAGVERDWQLRVGAQLSGGTEALVFGVARADGHPAVLKVGVPGSLDAEALALQLADGVGYVRMLAFDESRSAMLLERLGEKLVDSGFPIREQIEIICRTLKSAWRQVDDRSGLRTGADKARWHRDFIEVQWEALGRPCPRRLRDRAVGYALEREREYDPAASVLVHGDAHQWNTLKVPGAPSGTAYAFVDPDGFVAEPAVDLSISLREWRDELLDGDTVGHGEARCGLLGELTGVEGAAIWQWGLIEHVSGGLLGLQLGDSRNAEKHFAIAERWLAVG